MFSKRSMRRSVVSLLLFLFLMISLIIPETLFAKPGDLDTTFNSTGKVTTSNLLRVNAVAIQSDGKIVMAGEGFNGTQLTFDVARYLTDGTPDTTFNSTGFVWISISGSTEDKANAVAIQSDGKIVAVGKSYFGATTGNDFAIVRYNTNGTLDTTFNSTGTLTFTFDPAGTNDDIAYAVAIQSDGKIVVAGQGPSNYGDNSFSLIRLNTNGSLDTTFGTSGKVTTDIFTNRDDFATAVAIQSDGKIVAAGFANSATSGDDFAVVRYNTNGTLDTTFNPTGATPGIATTAVASGSGADRGQAVAIDSSGKILAAGYTNSATSGDDFALVRYTSTGTLDTTFNTTGIATTAVASGTGSDRAQAVAIDSSGKILAAGYASDGTNNKFALNRYTSAGALDTTFNSTGKVSTSIGSLNDIARGIALQSNGKIVVTGETEVIAGGGDFKFVVARYDAQTYSLSINDVSVTEGDSGTVNANFTVTLSGAAGQAVTVDYTTTSGTATSGADYTTTSGTLTFTAGQTTRTISVPVKGNTLNQDNRTFTVTLSNPSNATISQATGTGTIIDNDPVPTVQFTTASQKGTGEKGTMTVTARLSTASGKDITVPFSLSGSATKGTDYTITTSPLAIAAGKTTATITITIIEDTLVEGDETVVVVMGTPTNATKGSTTVHTATITDDDLAELTIDGVKVTEGKKVVTEFTVSLSAASAKDVTVDYETADGTAKAGADYTAVSGTLTFAAGETSKTISVTVLDDLLNEADETFKLKLSNATGATIKTAEGVGTIVDNDPVPTVRLDMTSISLSASAVALTTDPAGLSTPGDVATVTATLSEKSGRDVTVKLAFSGGATLGTDYTVSASEIVIPAGSLTGSVTVTALKNTNSDSTKGLVIGVASLTNVTLSSTAPKEIITAVTPAGIIANSGGAFNITVEGGAWGCSLVR